eukprot:symbB.v1.2.034206.t1/scaffold4376.1/size42885/1
MQAPVAGGIPEKPTGLPKQDAGMYRLQSGQSQVTHVSQVSGINVDPAEAGRSKTAPVPQLRLPEALPQPAVNGEPQPKSKNLPRTRRTSPEKGRSPDTAPKADEMSTRSSVPRRSRPTSPNSPTRSSSGHAQGAPRLCISVPEHRLKPPEPQFLFSLPLRVTTGPKKLVDWSFKGKESRSGSPSRWESTLSESPRSFVWSALEGPTPSSVHRGAASHRSPPRSARQGVTPAGSRNQPTPARAGATARPGVSTVGASAGLSTVSTPAPAPPVLSSPNFTWNGTGATAAAVPAVPNPSLLGQASARSVSPP